MRPPNGFTTTVKSLRLSSVPAEQVPGIHLVPHVIKAGVIAVCDDCLRPPLELGQVVHNHAPEERAAVLEGGLVDDDRRAFRLNALHHPLDAALAEVVAARLHRKPVYADNGIVLLRGIPAAVILVRSGHPEHLARDEVLTRAVALHYRGHHVLGHVLVVRQKLLRVLREAVAAVAERRVVVVRADPRVKADALDDGGRVQALDLGVRVKLVEVAHAEGQVRVGEELHRLSFLQAHVQRGDVLLYRALLKQFRERMRGLLQERYVGESPDGPVLLGELRMPDYLRYAHDDAARIEVVVKGLALTQELRGEYQVQSFQPLLPVLHIEAAAVAHGDGRLDDHYGGRIDLQHQVDDLLHVRGVEVVPHRVVVSRGGDDDVLGVRVCPAAVQGGRQVQRLLRQVLLDVLVLDRGLPPVDKIHLLRDDVHGGDTVVLGQKRGEAQPYVARAGYGDAVWSHISLSVW